MPKEPTGTTQLSLRLDEAMLRDLDAIAALLSVPGIEITRADAIRAALARGIPLLLQGRTAPVEARKPKAKR